MLNEENKNLLETALSALKPEALEDVEVEETTEEVVESTEDTTKETVEESAVYTVWEEDEEDQDAEDMDEEEDDGIEGSKDPDEDPSDAEVMEMEDEDDAEESYNMNADADEEDEDEDEVDVDDVDVSADDAEDDMEDEIEDEEEMDSDDMDMDDEDDEEEIEEMDDEDDGIEGSEQPHSDVDHAIDQISKTITAAATAKAIEKIEASYSMKEDIDALCASDDSLTEEFKTKAATIFEAAVSAKVREQVEEIKESYTDYVDEEISALHEGLMDKIDVYLTYVAEQWIDKNDVAVSNILRTEIAESFMTSLKDTFVNHYIEMPEGKTDMFDEISQQNCELAEDVDAKQAKIDELSEQIVSLEKAQIVSELSEGLATTQVAKFKELTEDIAWESPEAFTKKAKVIRESYFAQKKVEESEVKKANTETTTQVVVEEVEEQTDENSLMSRYIKASTKLQKEAF